MTENERMSISGLLDVLDTGISLSTCHIEYAIQSNVLEDLIRCLEELEQYRAIGTVEDITDGIKQSEEEFNMLTEYLKIGTVEELKDLKEKDTPYKPQEYEDRYYACKCDNILLPKWRKYPTELMPKSEGLPHCMACGQKLDWQ